MVQLTDLDFPWQTKYAMKKQESSKVICNKSSKTGEAGHPGRFSSFCRTVRVLNRSQTPHINTIYSDPLLRGGPVGRDQCRYPQLLGSQTRNTSPHAGLPASSCNSSGIYFTGNALLQINTADVQDPHGKFPQISVFIQLQLKLQDLFSQTLTSGIRQHRADQLRHTSFCNTWLFAMIAIRQTVVYRYRARARSLSSQVSCSYCVRNVKTD